MARRSSVLLAWVAGASLVAGGPGCKSASPRPDTKPASKKLGAADGIMPDTGVIRTGFHAKAEPGQELGVHLEMARGHESQGQLDAAAVDYQKAIAALERPGMNRGSARDVAGQKATAHRKLAVVLDRLGRFAESDVHYKAALKLAPGDPKVWNNAGYSLYVQGRWAEAERTLRTARRLAPDDSKVATNFGLALAASGKRDEALEVLTRAGGPAAAHANLGYVLAATDRPAEAAAEFRQALALQPGLPDAAEALAKLGSNASASTAAPAAVVAAPPADLALVRTSAVRSVAKPR